MNALFCSAARESGLYAELGYTVLRKQNHVHGNLPGCYLICWNCSALTSSV